MRLLDATLDHRVCELFTRLYLGGEQSGCEEQMIAGFFDAFPAFSKMGVRRLPHSLQDLKSRALMLGCWAAICRRLVQQGQVPMALYVLLGLSAYSRPSTLLATRRCDLVKPAKDGSLFWALLQHLQEEARPSKTQRYDEGCLLDSLHLNGLQDLFLAKSGAHDRSPIWSVTYPQVAGAVQRAASEAGLGTVISSLRRQHRRGSQISVVGCGPERGAWSQAKSMHRYEHSSRIAADHEKLAADVRTLCKKCENVFAESCWAPVIL